MPLQAACCFVYCLVYCLATAAWYASYAWYTAWYTRWRSSITDTRQISALSQDQPRQTSHLIILLFCIFSVLICNTVTLQCIGRTNLATNTTVLWSQVVRAVLGLGFSKQKSCHFLIFSPKHFHQVRWTLVHVQPDGGRMKASIFKCFHTHGIRICERPS